MVKKRTKRQNRQAEKTRRQMSAAAKRDKPVKDLLKRTLGGMAKEDKTKKPGNGNR